jgi:hypothetical protein
MHYNVMELHCNAKATPRTRDSGDRLLPKAFRARSLLEESAADNRQNTLSKSRDTVRKSAREARTVRSVEEELADSDRDLVESGR